MKALLFALALLLTKATGFGQSGFKVGKIDSALAAQYDVLDLIGLEYAEEGDGRDSKRILIGMGDGQAIVNINGRIEIMEMMDTLVDYADPMVWKFGNEQYTAVAEIYIQGMRKGQQYDSGILVVTQNATGRRKKFRIWAPPQ